MLLLDLKLCLCEQVGWIRLVLVRDRLWKLSLRLTFRKYVGLFQLLIDKAFNTFSWTDLHIQFLLNYCELEVCRCLDMSRWLLL